MTELNFTLAEILGLVEEPDPEEGEGSADPNLALDQKPRKSNRKLKVDSKELETINRHLAADKDRTIAK